MAAALGYAGQMVVVMRRHAPALRRHTVALGTALCTFACMACASVDVAVDVASHPHTVQPERPSVATHASTVAPAYVEIETGVEHDRIDASTRADQIPTVIKIGIAPRVQLSVFAPLSSATGVAFGLGDIGIGVKVNLAKDHPWLSDVAILPQVKFSTGGVRGTGTTDATLLLINSRKFGPVGVDFNVGVTRRSGDNSQVPRTSTLLAAASSIPVRGNLAFAVECFGYPGTGGPAGSAPIVGALFGPTFLVRPELAIDAGLIERIAGPQPRAFYFGLVANLGRLPLPVRSARAH